MDGNIYLKKLQEAYYRNGGQKEWDSLMAAAHGISDADKAALLAEYPDTPQSLLQILERIDGTYYRKYGDKKYCRYFFCSDVSGGEYPYYLNSFADIMNNRNAPLDYDEIFAYHLREPDDELFVSDKILCLPDQMKWLHFSDCMNNGGTSALYIDFTPSEKGTCGQIVRYLHDPDEIEVIADSFDAFLDMIVESGMIFLDPDDFR